MRNAKLRQPASALTLCVLSCVLGPFCLNGFSPAVFSVLLAGALLPPAYALLSAGGYLLAGLLLPVYPLGASGFSFLFGSSGGYLLSLLPAAAAVSLSVRLLKKKYPLALLLGLSAAAVLYFGVGTLWYLVSGSGSFAETMRLQGIPLLLFSASALAAFLCALCLGFRGGKRGGGSKSAGAKPKKGSENE